MNPSVNDEDFNRLMYLIKELSLNFLNELDKKYGQPTSDEEDHKRFMLVNAGYQITVATSFVLGNFTKEYMLKFAEDMFKFSLEHVSENADEIAEYTLNFMRKKDDT